MRFMCKETGLLENIVDDSTVRSTSALDPSDNWALGKYTGNGAWMCLLCD